MGGCRVAGGGVKAAPRPQDDVGREGPRRSSSQSNSKPLPRPSPSLPSFPPPSYLISVPPLFCSVFSHLFSPSCRLSSPSLYSLPSPSYLPCPTYRFLRVLPLLSFGHLPFPPLPTNPSLPFLLLLRPAPRVLINVRAATDEGINSCISKGLSK